MSTPGPWHAEFGECAGYDCMTSGWDIRAGTDHVVTVDEADNSPQATKANAYLIAAAPELLAACKRAKKLLEPELTKEPDRTIFWELVEAIRKAEGREP